MPVAKPGTLPRWAETAGGVAAGAGQITAPSSGKQDTGWNVAELPPAQIFNWLLWTLYQWIKWINDLANQAMTWTAAHIFQAGVTVTQSTLNTAAAILTGNGTAPGVDATGGATAPAAKLTAGGAGTPAAGALQLVSQTTPSAPANGQLWYDGTDLVVRVGGVSKALTGPVSVDNVTIELNAGALRIKALGVDTAQIKDAAVTQAKRAAATATIGADSGTFDSAVNNTFQTITNLSVTIACTGRPVLIVMEAVRPGAEFNSVAAQNVFMDLWKDGVTGTNNISRWRFKLTASASDTPITGFSKIDVPAAGSHTYTVTIQSDLAQGNPAVHFKDWRLVAVEL
jgi:hypothetical protein